MTNLVKGSIGDVMLQSRQSLAVTFLSCDVVVLVDTSGSMCARDVRGGQSRYDQACWELAELQASMPGKIGVISFSDSAMFCANGVPEFLGGMTDLAGALRFTKIADVPGAMRFIVISDGEPTNPEAALQIAKTYKNRIDVIFVGNEAIPTGRNFLERLAKASGGQAVTASLVKGLATEVHKLLATA